MFSRVSFLVIAVTGISLITGIAQATLALNWTVATDLAARIKPSSLHELFARAAIVVALVGFAIAIFGVPNIPTRTDYGLSVNFMLAIYGAGVLFALLDHSIILDMR